LSLAGPPPTVAPGGPPLSILVDYDGTVTRFDVGDALLARFVDSPEVARLDALYEAGRVGSRELMGWDMEVLPDEPELLRVAAQAIPHDPDFRRFADLATEATIPLEVVSDGLGFYVRSNLAALGLADVPVATNVNRLTGDRTGLSFPYGHPHCFVCGTCKRERVRAHQAAGRAVIFIGDGASDRYAAFHADLVFAKDQLARLCGREGWPFQPWTDFADLSDWLAGALRSGELPTDAGKFGAWQAAHRSAAWSDARSGGPGFICGPEIWGPDRDTPA
jgi:HAD superfamily phosphoserine phosphatase-like hydrolase